MDMTIDKTVLDGGITLKIHGKLNAKTAEEFGEVADAAIADSDTIVMDFDDVSYLASAGLRVMVSSQKKVKAKDGSLRIINVKPNVFEVFEMTGLDDVLKIEQAPD